MCEQDRFLPIANIGRIMKKGLPANGKIAKDAKDTVQECVSEFISFVTSEASDKCQKEKRKTINGDDLMWAMATLGFEDYIAPLKVYLARYRELEGDTKGPARGADGSEKKDSLKTQLGSDTQGTLPQILENIPSDFFERIVNLLKESTEICYKRTREIPCLTCPSKPKGSMFAMKYRLGQLQAKKKNRNLMSSLQTQWKVMCFDFIYEVAHSL